MSLNEMKSFTLGSSTYNSFVDETARGKIDKMAAYVTPEMYGAKGDGVTDDSAALQAACDTGEPVFITKNIAIANSVEVKNSVTIKDGVSVYVTADVHGFIMRGEGKTIRGGRITTKLSDPTHALIHIDGGRHCNVQNVVIDYDKSGVVQLGIGVLIQPLTADSSCFNTIKDCYFFNLKYGVRIAKSGTHWVTCNYIKSTFNFCSTAIYATDTGNNTFDIEGQAGNNDGFNTNIYMGENCHYNHCTVNIVDTGNPGRNQYDVIIANASSENFVSGVLAGKMLGANIGDIDYIDGHMPEPIPGVYDVFANKEATYEPIGNSYVNATGVFKYPKKAAADRLSVKNILSNEDGVMIAIPVEKGISRLYMYFSTNASPKKVEVSFDGTNFKEVNWLARYIGIFDIFDYGVVQASTNIYIRMLGACSVTNPDRVATEIECLDLAATSYRGWSDFKDPFVGVRKTGSDMTGDLTFAQGKGVVLTDENGKQYRLKVGTDGTISATEF